MIVKKTPEEIEKMAVAGKIVAGCLQMLREKCKPGVKTIDLDTMADEYIRSYDGVPAFKNYRGFPSSICASPNSTVVHGIPGTFELKRGDIISIDVGVQLDGWMADAAITVPVGQVGAIAKQLMDTTLDSLYKAVEQCRQGNRLGDVSHAVEKRVEKEQFSVVRSLVGHGIGKDLHEDPQVPNFGMPDRGPELEAGYVLAIEPMINAGAQTVRVGNDNWAIYSEDGSLAAHFEHTVAITEDGPRILTPWDDG